MKSIEIKELSFIVEEGKKGSYANLLKAVVNAPPQSGFTADEMRSRIRILDCIEKANGKLELEDSDVKKLKACAKEMKWAMMNKEILQFCDDVEEM